MENKVKEIMAAVFNVNPSAINDTVTNNDIDTWESLSHLNLITALEEEFNIVFEDAEIMELTSYKKIIELLNNKLN